MDFVSNYENWPYFFMKLLTPYVSGHHGNSTEFLHRRGMALLIHAHFILIGRVLKKDFSKVNWNSKKLYLDLGRLNLKYAENYKKSISQYKSNLKVPEICNYNSQFNEAKDWAVE